MTADKRLVDALKPLTSRCRTDVTAVRRPGKSAAWTSQPLTDERIGQHLNGGPARGLCPIREGESTTMVGLLDFDSHKGEVSWVAMSETVAGVVDCLELAHGMEPILFRSSGGAGVHLMLIFQEPQDCYSLRQFLGHVLASCGLKSGDAGVKMKEVEIFPKQNNVAAGKFGSMFVLPLANRSVPLSLNDEEPLW